MKIVLVEDNRGFGERLYKALSTLASVWWVISEREFRDSFEQIKKEPPDALVIDTMLRWDYPRRDAVEVPPDAKDLYTAGVRCAKLLSESKATTHLPVILYTVFDEADLKQKTDFPPNVSYLQKTSDTAGLLEAVRSAMTRTVITHPADQTVASS
jgi:DNA-binding NarL/FixJ family response regulator